jgi:hypothetical protein
LPGTTPEWDAVSRNVALYRGIELCDAEINAHVTIADRIVRVMLGALSLNQQLCARRKLHAQLQDATSPMHAAAVSSVRSEAMQIVTIGME